MTALSTQAPTGLSPARTPDPGTAAEAAPDLDRVLRTDALRSVFQPVVDLRTGRTVALEAFVRGPRDSALGSPAALFRAAARTGRVAELDRAALRTALRTAADAGLAAPWTLFVNASLDALELPDIDLDVDIDIDADIDAGTEPGTPALAAATPSRIVVDVPGRALVARPADVLRLVERVRDRGWGVALDDVGADTALLALLPVVRPDVVKLDLHLLRRRTADEVAAVVGAVAAWAGRSGALVLAEGVETDADRDTALAAGAHLGQGWAFGRPGLLGDVLADAGVPAHPLAPAHLEPRLDLPRGPDGVHPDVFARVAATAPVLATTLDVVQQSARHLTLLARRSTDPAVVVTLGGDGARRLADEAGGTGVRAHAALPAYGLLVLGTGGSGVVLGRPTAAGRGGWELVTSHDPVLVADLTAGLLTGPPPTPAPFGPPTAAAPGPTPRPAARPTASPTARSTARPARPVTRPAIADLVAAAIESDRRTGTGTGLLVVGVDGPEPVTSRGGRDALVRRMRRAVRSVDRWIPLGPDHFAVLLTGLPRAGSEGVVERVADALLLAAELAVDDHPTLSVSIGASLAPTRAVTGTEAHRQALAALEAARGAGGHCARIWPV